MGAGDLCRIARAVVRLTAYRGIGVRVRGVQSAWRRSQGQGCSRAARFATSCTAVWFHRGSSRRGLFAVVCVCPCGHLRARGWRRICPHELLGSAAPSATASAACRHVLIRTYRLAPKGNHRNDEGTSSSKRRSNNEVHRSP
jgi:hypothetical protein